MRKELQLRHRGRPYLERFRELKLRTQKLLELRTDLERRRMLAKAMAGDEDSLPNNLRPVFQSMKQQNVEISDQELAEREASFWRLLDLMFSENEDILQGEVVFIETDESTTAFRYPREREVPAGLTWHGLRSQRTFCAQADCLVDVGTERCLLIQIRPRDYPGSAGLTVGFKQER